MDNRDQDRGIALLTVILLLLLFLVVIAGFYYVVNGEQAVATSDRDNAVAFYGSQGALEQMSYNIAAFFQHHTSPTPAQIDGLTASSYLPSIPNVTFPAGGYAISCQKNNSPSPPTWVTPCADVGSTLDSTVETIGGNGPLAGLTGIVTPFLLSVVADGPDNTEVKMTRQVQEVAVPVFEFGIFSDNDLAFFAGPAFGFGGRIHTNGNLYLAEDGSTLTIDDKTTAYKDVIRTQLENGYPVTSGGHYSTTVDVLTSSGGCSGTLPACRPLGLTEGSVVGGPGSATNPNWQNLSLNTYNSWIENGATGAKKLDLDVALAGGSPIAMIQRAPAGEDPTGTVGSARFMNQASLRIILSDAASDITGLPGVDTTVAPYPLDENLITRGTGTTGASTSGPFYLPPTNSCNPPLAESPGYSADSDYMEGPNSTLLGGYIKIEIQTPPSSPTAPPQWKDVTQEVLGLGISSDIQSSGTMVPAGCTNLSILHLERVYPAIPFSLSAGSGSSRSGFGSGSGALSSGITYSYTVIPVVPGLVFTRGYQESFTATSTGSINVSWASAYPSGYPGATGYDIYRTTTPGIYTGSGNGYYILSGGSTTSFTDNGTTSSIPILNVTLTSPGVMMDSETDTDIPQNFIPINMYDAREGEVRDVKCSTSNSLPECTSTSPETDSLNGVMNLLEINVHNLQLWFANQLCNSSTWATSCSSGALAYNNGGYIVYVSDRRGNYCSLGGPACVAGSDETGEYGNEDLINPSSSTGIPDGILDSPEEDLDGDGVFRTYGETMDLNLIVNSAVSGSPDIVVDSKCLSSSSCWYNTSNSDMAAIGSMPQRNSLDRISPTQAAKNSVIFFRRAVRLVDGTAGNLPPFAPATCTSGATGGFTVAAENPIYIEGDYNANPGGNGFNDTSTQCHVPAAVIGDAVTFLSNNWDGDVGDDRSLDNPANLGGRPASTTWYRTAIISGTNKPFPLPTWASARDYGTDGGVHNFLRMIENWGGKTLNYRGSMASFYYARQATGVYKCCTVVYGPPTRAYAFDTDFQNITELPPGTPRFTDVNALSFHQSILPTQ